MSEPKSESRPTRRDVLAAGGAAAGALALAGCGGGDPYALPKPPVPGSEAWAHGEEAWVTSVCGQCPAGCGIKVRVVEGRAVKIEGSPAHPLNRGAIGPKGQAGLQVLYHPDRLRGPVRRDGPRGSGRWKPVGWDEAIGEIAGSLRSLREKGEARGLVVVDGEPRGMVPELWDRFLAAFGSPNHVDHRSATDGGKLLATWYMHGVPELPAYDWQGTRYVIGFGASLFESWCQTIHLMRASSYLRRGIPGRRVKIVQVAPRFSTTAAKADEWIPIEPATYGALALALGHVLVRDSLYDEAFVRDRTFGFEDWTDAAGAKHRGFRDLLMSDYPPEKVAAVTGVRKETIERLAREMAENRPTVALADGGAAAATNGLGTAMAIHALNALLGNLERPGGTLVQRRAPLAPWAPLEPDKAAVAGRAEPRVDGAGTPALPLARSFLQGLPEALLSGKPYPVQALFLYRSNPLFAKPQGRRWREALQKVPLVVSFSPLPDESAAAADFVLPDHTYLERWEVVEPVPSVGWPLLGLRRPAVPPLHDTRATGDVILALARALGPPVAAAFPWESYRDAQVERLEGIRTAGTGSPEGAEMDEFVTKLEESGGWWAAPYAFEKWDGAFPTPSGKFEFYSQGIASRLAELFPEPASLEKHLADRGVETRGDGLCLPHWEPPRFAGVPSDYPLVLVVYRGIEYAEGGSRHLPALRELPMTRRYSWQERVEVHPEDAHRLGLREGRPVWVESPAGRRRLVVVLHPGVRPGTIAVPLGHGPWPPNPEEPDQAGGYALLANANDPLAGILAVQGTRCRIRKDA